MHAQAITMLGLHVILAIATLTITLVASTVIITMAILLVTMAVVMTEATAQQQH